MWRQKENIGEGWSRQSLEVDELTAQGDNDSLYVIYVLLVCLLVVSVIMTAAHPRWSWLWLSLSCIPRFDDVLLSAWLVSASGAGISWPLFQCSFVVGVWSNELALERVCLLLHGHCWLAAGKCFHVSLFIWGTFLSMPRKIVLCEFQVASCLLVSARGHPFMMSTRKSRFHSPSCRSTCRRHEIHITSLKQLVQWLSGSKTEIRL